MRDEAWRAFFARWAEGMGAPVGLDIWRFKLPDRLIWQEPEQPGVWTFLRTEVRAPSLPLQESEMRPPRPALAAHACLSRLSRCILGP